MSKVGVNGAADDLGVDGFKISALIVELADFSWAHECEIKRPEEQDDILAYAKQSWFRLSYNGVRCRSSRAYLCIAPG